MKNLILNLTYYLFFLTGFGVFLPVTAQNNIDTLTRVSLNTINNFFIKDTNQLFFPNKFLFDTINPDADGTKSGSVFYERRKDFALFINARYSGQLIALREPILFKKYDNECYRFTWLRTFHNPISLRIENINEIIHMYVKCTNGMGGYCPGDLFVNDTVVITKKDWIIFKNIIDSTNFWSIPSIERTDIVVSDGSKWIFEGQNGSLYHMVERECGKKKEIGDACLFLLKLSKLKIKKKEFY